MRSSSSTELLPPLEHKCKLSELPQCFRDLSQSVIVLVFLSSQGSETEQLKITIDFVDPSLMQDVCHMNFVIELELTIESLWLSGRALEHGIQRSEV